LCSTGRAVRPRSSIGESSQLGEGVSDLATAEQAQELVAGFLQGESALHGVAMFARHRDRIRIAEEVRRVQHQPVCRNPSRSILVRGIEAVYACDEALRLIAGYQSPRRHFTPHRARAGVGYACTEAPRGILYHRYRPHKTRA
jgi:coenzyme F420-reducing hydrogenase alpha subunit